MTDLADSILAAYNAHDLTKIELPEEASEFGWPTVVYARVFTLNDRNRIEVLLKKNEAEAMLAVVVRHTCDEDGKRLFTHADMLKVGASPSWLITHIATAILATMPDFSDTEKNS